MIKSQNQLFWRRARTRLIREHRKASPSVARMLRRIIPLLEYMPMEQLLKALGREVFLSETLCKVGLLLGNALCQARLFEQAIVVMRWLDQLRDPKAEKEHMIQFAHQLSAFAQREEPNIERRINIISTLSDLLETHDAVSEAAALRFKAARLLLDAQALSAAWRALDEVEALAESVGRNKLVADAVFIKTAVLLESGDLENALKTGIHCYKTYEQYGIKVPPGLISNIGLCYLRTDQYEQAAKIYEELIVVVSRDQKWVSQVWLIYLNLAVCYRELKKKNNAQESLERAWMGASSQANPEQLLELCLVSAKTNAFFDELDTASENLLSAVEFLDEMLGDVIRPHYRRWIRRNYVKRIEEVFSYLSSTGSAHLALNVFARSRAGTTSDWIALLNWQDQSRLQLGDAYPAEELDLLIKKIQDYGAPYGLTYREKYDDAFHRKSTPSPWDQFNEYLLANIEKVPGLRHPFDGIGAHLAKVLERSTVRRLQIFSVVGAQTYVAFVWKEKYERVSIDEVVTEGYVHTRLEYELDQTKSATEFIRQLEFFANCVREKVEALLNAIDFSEIDEIMIFPDPHDYIPIHAVLLGCKNITSAMSQGLSIVTCPILAEGRSVAQFPSSVASIYDPTLELAKSEQSVVASSTNFHSSACASTRLFTEKDEEQWLRADVLHIAAHGLPISMYTEPWLSSLWSSDGTGLSFEWVQKNSDQFQAKLCLLNMCHSADRVSRNHQENFIAGDGADFPSLFLINRKSTVLACGWRTLDTVSYVLTANFIQNLGLDKESNFARVFSRTLAQLRRFPAESFEKAINVIGDAELRSRKLINVSASRLESMFRSAYALGAYRCYQLLPND
jgi:tetratricopeptide (TPR) repeat protein